MNDSEERRDEASRRLGGPSKIGELQEQIADLAKKAEKLMEYSQVHIGKKIIHSGNLLWVGADGIRAYNVESTFRIEALGYDWCVIRGGSLDSVLFAATSPASDIREALAQIV